MSQRLLPFFGPRRWRELVDLGDLGRGQPGEQIREIFEGIDPVPPATAQQGVNHRAPFPGFRMPKEQKILFSKGAGPNQIFQEIGVNFQDAVVHKLAQCLPPF